jgi:hypothetical protein
VESSDRELREALELLRASGRNAEGFSFDLSQLPPDPDGGGMYTVQYEVKITNNRTSKFMTVIGGIGSRWLDEFGRALEDGYFD